MTTAVQCPVVFSNWRLNRTNDEGPTIAEVNIWSEYPEGSVFKLYFGEWNREFRNQNRSKLPEECDHTLKTKGKRKRADPGSVACNNDRRKPMTYLYNRTIRLVTVLPKYIYKYIIFLFPSFYSPCRTNWSPIISLVFTGFISNEKAL